MELRVSEKHKGINGTTGEHDRTNRSERRKARRSLGIEAFHTVLALLGPLLAPSMSLVPLVPRVAAFWKERRKTVSAQRTDFLRMEIAA